MRKVQLLTFCLLLFVLPSKASYSPAINKLIREVKEASYYDSAKLFKVGEQTIKQAIASSSQAAVAEVHLYYGNYFFYVRNLEKAKKYFEQSLEESKKWKNSHIEILSEIRLLFLEYETGSSEQVEKDLNLLLEKSKQIGDFENVAELYNLLGIIKQDKSDAQAAVKSYLEGLTISEIHNLNYYPAVFRNNLGLIKLGLGQTKEALEDFEKGLIIAEKENSKRLAGHIQMNICLAYVSDNKPEKAYPLFEKVIQYSRQNNLHQELASNFINLASAFSNAGQNEKAISYIDSAIVVLKQHHFDKELAKAYLNKTNVFVMMNRIPAAEALLLEIEQLTSKTGNLEDLSSYYFMKYRIE